MRVRRLFVAWTALALVGWIVLGALAEKEEADCRASGNLFCGGDPGAWFLFVGLFVAGVWLVGAIIIAAISMGTSVTVRDGVTVTVDCRVYRSGERMVVSKAQAERLRERGDVE